MSGSDRVIERSIRVDSPISQAEALAAARYQRVYANAWPTYAAIVGERGVRLLASQCGSEPDHPIFVRYAAEHIEELVLDEGCKWGFSLKPPHPFDQELICAFFKIESKGRKTEDIGAAVMEGILEYTSELDNEHAIALREAGAPQDAVMQQDAVIPAAQQQIHDQPEGVDVVTHVSFRK